VAGTSEDRKGKAAQSSILAPTHINATVATRALEEFQSYGFSDERERNVPLIYLKKAEWHDKDGADGYYCHYEDEGRNTSNSISSFSCGST